MSVMIRMMVFLYLLLGVSSVFAQVVNIGVLAYNGKVQAMKRWQPTADYLSQQIVGIDFNIMPLTHEEFNHSINKKSIDFLLTNPGHFVLLAVERKATSIATFIYRYGDQQLNQFSAVLFTLNNGVINSLADLRGKTLAAVNEEAFGGFQLAQNELLSAGIDVNKDLNILWLGFPHADLVKAVLTGKADAATVRSGVLEKMAAQGQLQLDDIKILALKENKHFPFARSFDMFPEWPFAKLPHTDLDLSKKVVKALLNMPGDDEAALMANGAGWTIPLNYSSVHRVLKRLQVAPYLPRPFSMSDLWQVYKQWIIAIIVLFFISVLLLLRFYQSNKQLKATQLDLQQSRTYLEQAVVERTDELNRLNQSLKTEIERHITTASELSKGCDALKNIYLIFVRDDLTRAQRLNSVVEALRFYLDFEYVMLSRVDGEHFNLCCVRPNIDTLSSPLSQTWAMQVIQQKKPFYREQDEQWSEYLSCPVFLNGQLSYLFELASSAAYKQVKADHNESKLSHNILYLIAHWVGYEALSMSLEKESESKHSAMQERFKNVTAREKEVIKLLMQGESNKSMARLLNLSVKTVEMHRANALRKTEAKSSTEIVQMAVLSGLFE